MILWWYWMYGWNKRIMHSWVSWILFIQLINIDWTCSLMQWWIDKALEILTNLEQFRRCFGLAYFDIYLDLLQIWPQIRAKSADDEKKLILNLTYFGRTLVSGRSSSLAYPVSIQPVFDRKIWSEMMKVQSWCKVWKVKLKLIDWSLGLKDK